MRKTRIICSMILVFSIANLFGQVSIIKLKHEANSICSSDYYISSIVDATKNELNIGYIPFGDSPEITEAKFQDGIEAELYNYFKESQVEQDSDIPILLRVLYLNIQEKKTTKEYGRADISLEFYRVNNGMVAKVFQTHAFAEDYDTDVTLNHEKRIRKAINRCLVSFEKSSWKTTELDWISLEQLRSQKSAIENPQTTVTKDVDLNISTDILNFQYSIGTNTQGFHIQYLVYNDSISVGKWFIPASFTFSGFIVEEELLYDLNYQSMRSWTFGVLIPFTKRIRERVLISLQGGIGFGTENLIELNSNTSTRFIFTANTNQVLMFVPKKEFGLNFGVGVYQNFITSKVYNWDFGVKLILGMKF